MTAAGRYLTGLTVVAATGAGLLSLVRPSIQTEMSWGMVAGLLVQAPLGWWTIRSIGTERFQLVWTAGMAIRLAVVFVAGVVVVPALGWQMGPVLGSLTVTLVVLLLVEIMTAWQEHSGIKGR